MEEECAPTRSDDVDRRPPARYDPVERVAAGTVYVVLSGLLFLLWLWTDVTMLGFMALPTLVAGLVSLAVGWPQLRRKLARERHRGGHDSPSPPRPTSP
jgi:hypothetical protein